MPFLPILLVCVMCVFFSFLFGRDVDDNNIHIVRNVFVPFDADDVVIICEFCRTEVVISNRL